MLTRSKQKKLPTQVCPKFILIYHCHSNYYFAKNLKTHFTAKIDSFTLPTLVMYFHINRLTVVVTCNCSRPFSLVNRQ